MFSWIFSEKYCTLGPRSGQPFPVRGTPLIKKYILIKFMFKRFYFMKQLNLPRNRRGIYHQWLVLSAIKYKILSDKFVPSHLTNNKLNYSVADGAFRSSD